MKKHPLDHFFAPVGKVLVLFNQIETTLIIFAGGMCLPEFKAITALMAEASFSRKLDGLKCIADEKIRDAVTHGRFMELLKRLQRAEDIRNRVAHTLWANTTDGQLKKLKWSGKRKTGNLPALTSTTLEEIEQMAQEIQDAFLDLENFMRTLQTAGILKMEISKS